MDILEYNIEVWCRRATSLIRFAPDRWKVYDELQAHLTDHRDALLEQGLTPEEATQKALDAMGDPEQIAPQLAAIHRPFWGYFLRTNLILAAILLIVCCISMCHYWKNLDLGEPDLRDFAVYDSASYGGDTGRTLLHLSQPNASFSSDGSTFTLTDAALYSTVADEANAGSPQLVIRIQQRTLLPWAEHREYLAYYSNITDCFFARDSLGNTYNSFFRDADSSTPLYIDGKQSGIFTYTHECWINDFPADAEWVEICYKRDGRSFALRIDLTGGTES